MIFNDIKNDTFLKEVKNKEKVRKQKENIFRLLP